IQPSTPCSASSEWGGNRSAFTSGRLDWGGRRFMIPSGRRRFPISAFRTARHSPDNMLFWLSFWLPPLGQVLRSARPLFLTVLPPLAGRLVLAESVVRL